MENQDNSNTQNSNTSGEQKPSEHPAKQHSPSHHSTKHHAAKEGGDLSLDFSGIKKFFSNTSLLATILTVLFILVPVIFTFYIRTMPEGLPQTDNWARESVNNFYRGQIANQVNAQYPNLPQANKDQLVNQQLEQYLKTNEATLSKQIQETSKYFKSGFQYEENGYLYTFLGDLDSYFYLRQARNLAKSGTICDELKNGQCWDNQILAPLGGPVTPNLHPYGIVWLYKITHIFDKSMNLMRSSFFLPTVLAALACVAAFFIGRRLMNEVAGFFAAMLVALNPMLITRTLGSDTDIWNITLPLIIIWIFIESFESKNLYVKIGLSALAGLFMGVFAFAWGGWWYVFVFILISVAIYLIATLVKNYIENRKLSNLFNTEMRNDLITTGVLIIASAVFVTVFVSFSSFMSTFIAPFSTVTNLKEAVQVDLWPNVFTTVAELNEASISTVISQTAFGTNWLFSLSLMGIVLSMIKRKPGIKEYVLIILSFLIYLYLTSSSGSSMSMVPFLILLLIPIVAAGIMYLIDKNTQLDLKPAILFAIWFVVMIYASVKGVRFILLLTPIFAIAVGAAVGYVFQYLTRLFSSELSVGKTVSAIISFLVLLLILVNPIQAGLSAGSSFTPTMTKGWWDTLTKIKTESSPDAVINSWWDFGHWFKYVAERRVTLDGVTQNHPNAHWLGLILQTSNDREALGILRMLDCGSNTAFEEVDKKIKDTEKSENIISKLVVLDKQNGEAYLKSLGFTSSEISAISANMYCTPPEDYFITSEDMIGKAGVWAHFGLWNFDRAYMIKVVKPLEFAEGTKILMDRFGYTEEQASSTYYAMQGLQSDREINDWVAPWPGYMMGNWIGGCQNITTQESNDVMSNATNTSNTTKPIQTKVRGVACPINAVVSQDENGRQIIEGAIFDIEKPSNSSLVLSVISNAGSKVGSALVKPESFVVADGDTIIKHSIENATFPYDVVLDRNNNRLLLAAPELSQSLFTRLYFLDGRGSLGFEKFSDVTDVTGLRIAVWKVNWSAIDAHDALSASRNQSMRLVDKQ